MPNTYKKIASVTVGSGGAASIEFTGIPQTYTDLKIVASIRTVAAFNSDDFTIIFNANATNYTQRNVIGSPNAGTVASGTGSIGYFNGNTATANVFGNLEIYIPNYTSSNYKSFSSDTVNESNDSTTRPTFAAGLWSNTAAITSVKFNSLTSSNFMQYSTATLYGIKSS